jgi:hypothetical protein
MRPRYRSDTEQDYASIAQLCMFVRSRAEFWNHWLWDTIRSEYPLQDRAPNEEAFVKRCVESTRRLEDKGMAAEITQSISMTEFAPNTDPHGNYTDELSCQGDHTDQGLCGSPRSAMSWKTEPMKQALGCP